MKNSSIDIPGEKTLKWRFKREEIIHKINEIESLYANSSVKLSPKSELSSLLKSARELANAWASGESGESETSLLFKTLHIERISSGMHGLEFEEKRDKYLNDLLNGSLNFFERKPSHAKSILWELEVWSKIKRSVPKTYLEEPDIVVELGGYSIAIPCKKIFSESGVSKVISNAVSQIEKAHEFGIVAINVDDLLPENSVLNGRTFAEIADKLHSKNMEFLHRHERHFLKYLSKSRIIAVIASTSIVVDVHHESPKFSNASQWAIWTVPNLKKSHEEQIRSFAKTVMV